MIFKEKFGIGGKLGLGGEVRISTGKAPKEPSCLERAERGSSAGGIGGAGSTGCTRGYMPAPLPGLMSYHPSSAVPGAPSVGGKLAARNAKELASLAPKPEKTPP